MTLRNGTSVRLRAIRPDDELRLMALCRRLSPRTVYERFFSFRPLLPEQAHVFAPQEVQHRRHLMFSSNEGRELDRQIMRVKIEGLEGWKISGHVRHDQLVEVVSML